MMAERVGISENTYMRVEKGNPRVSLGTYAMALFALGMGDVFQSLIDPARDEQGLAIEEERLPKRVRVRKREE